MVIVALEVWPWNLLHERGNTVPARDGQDHVMHLQLSP